ncbi:MAG: DNA repair protein RecO [Candidatus Tenebribacter burtonii]|nr:DNA repair protein RecO [Candidatus Tenebribacter burtonii]
MSRDIKTKGIIIKKINFRETSIILDVLTPQYGVISIMAKGIRKQKSKNTGLLEILNELELDLYKNPSSEWYIYKSSQIINAHLFNIDLSTSILMQAAVEVIRQIIISIDDSQAIYKLLETYLQFIRTVNKNGIAIFWRFLLKLYKVMGIEFNISNCIECSQRKQFFAYFPQKHGFICEDCYHPVNNDQVFKINENAADLISKLKNIGNYIEEITISKPTVKQLNRIFITHLSEHFNKKIHLKSIELL